MIEWDEYLGLMGATEEQIQRVEARIGKDLPADLRDELRKNQGRTPRCFSLELPHGRKPSFRCLFHCDDRSEYSVSEISERTRILEDEFDIRDLIPFAEAANALFCIDYRQSNRPVVFVNLGLAPEDPQSCVRVANSFTEFCDMSMRPG